MRLRTLDFAGLAVAILLFVYLFRFLPSSSPYLYDEADYMSAGSRGILANYLDTPSLSMLDFFRLGRDVGLQKQQRSSLSEIVRTSGDVSFLRHFHGPFYYYYLASIGPLTNRAEYATRAAGLLFHILTAVAIYLACVWLLGADGRMIGSIAGLMVLLSFANLKTATQITPHIPYVFFSIVSLLLFAAYLKHAKPFAWYASVVAFTLALASVEYAVLLPLTFAICLYSYRKSLFAGRTRKDWIAFLTRTLALFLGTLFVLWPAGVLKLSATKAYFYIVYLTLKRAGAYGDTSALDAWRLRLHTAPFDYAIVAIFTIVAVLFYRRLPHRYLVLPCLVYGGLMFLTTAKNTSLNYTYVSSLLPPLLIVSAVVLVWIFSTLSTVPRHAATAAFLVLVLFGTYWEVFRPAMQSPARNTLDNVVDFVRTHPEWQTRRVLVPFDYLAVFDYYFPGMTVRAYLPDATAPAIVETFEKDSSEALLYAGMPDPALDLLALGRRTGPPEVICNSVVPHGQMEFFPPR